MNTADIVRDGEILINPIDWTRLNKKYSKDEIKRYISDAIAEHCVPMPFRDHTLGEAIASFKDLECFVGSSIIRGGEYFSRYPYRYSFKDLYVDISTVGSIASDYFHQESRWMCDSINSPSPYRTWTEEKFRLTLLNALWTLKFNQVTSKELRSAISLRKYIAAQFRPSAAKAIYEMLGARRVLDMSMGWGDRLAAFYAGSDTEMYFGTDPNSKLHAGYLAQQEAYQIKKPVFMFKDCAENLDVPKGEFDVAFTSPPYFNIERYTGTYGKDDKQSWNRYRKLDDWLEKFLFVVLEKSVAGLKSGGYLAMNISDVYSNHTVNQMCDPMNDYLSKMGLVYEGAVGLRMAKRPNSKACGVGVFAEPIWIWRKRG